MCQIIKFDIECIQRRDTIQPKIILVETYYIGLSLQRLFEDDSVWKNSWMKMCMIAFIIFSDI